MARILLIEDDRSIRTGVTDALRSDGHEVVAVRDGKGGLAQARASAPDLVVLDLMLPGIDGFEVCRLLRSGGCDVPVLVLSARSQEVDKVRALEGGADDYVTKPFGVAELLSRVRAHLRRLRPDADRSLGPCEVGTLVVDFGTYRATRAGRDIPLTAREFSLLGYLLRNRGRVVTRETLLREVWGHDEIPETRTVDTHVASLRRKVERDPRRPRVLVSVRGVGYRLEA